jgi:hypothetical protein
VADDALRDLIRFEVHEGRAVPQLEKHRTIRKIASGTPGWHVGKLRQTVKPPYGKAVLLANRRELADLGPSEAEAAGAKVYRTVNDLPK